MVIAMRQGAQDMAAQAAQLQCSGNAGSEALGQPVPTQCDTAVHTAVCHCSGLDLYTDSAGIRTQSRWFVVSTCKLAAGWLTPSKHDRPACTPRSDASRHHRVNSVSLHLKRVQRQSTHLNRLIEPRTLLGASTADPKRQ